MKKPPERVTAKSVIFASIVDLSVNLEVQISKGMTSWQGFKNSGSPLSDSVGFILISRYVSCKHLHYFPHSTDIILMVLLS